MIKKKAGQLFKSKNIKIAVVGSLFIKLFSALLALTSSILMARSMGLQDYGYYTLAFSIITLLTIPVSMGLPNLLVKYISTYMVNNKYSEIKGILIRTHQIVILSFLLVTIFGLISYYTWWNSFNYNLVSTIWIGFVALLFISLSGLRSAALRGMKLVVLGQIPDMLIRNLLLLMGVLYFYLNNIKLTPQIVMSILAFSTGIAFLFGHFFLYKNLLIKLKGVMPFFHNKEWVKEAIPFTINGGIQILRTKLITFVLATFGSIESVAIYDIALRGATLISFTLNALNTATSPFIASAFKKNNIKKLQIIVTKTSRIVFLGTIPIVLLFLFGGTSFIKLLFGKEYESAYIPLIIMGLGEFVSSMVGSVGLVLFMTGNQAYFTRNNFYIMILNVIICIPFVLFWDVLGAAIVFSLLLIIQNITLFLYTKKNLNINTTIFFNLLK